MDKGHTYVYNNEMSTRKADPKKSKKIKAERGFTPEEIILGGELLDVLENKNYAGQNIEVYWFCDYVWAVVVDGERLVSAWKSRKLKKEYGK